MGWVWAVGGVVLLGAGFLVAAVPRLRATALERRTEWSAARAGIATAAVSRDACAGRVPEAEALLARAEAITAGRGGATAAREAAGLAHRADLLWREAGHG
ncbi:DUF6403 family protein [Couchioplanes caeruleus]|uniref:DUF6403 family protein n=1 Tax=Couchioplanes caeruleus TaxID=56438 RepID=UPI0020BE9125|nr:DUF6403 family protein [Couchioplanes caeruleus]UQU67891.1 DUF6403 family protein [Couchioplanes caeruleus]